MAINFIVVGGNVGRDAEVRTANSGNQVANFSVVTDWGYGDNKESEWHDIVCFGKLAEFAGERIKKGMGVTVVGRVKTRSWEDIDTGKRMYKTSIIANTVDVTRWPANQPAAPAAPAAPAQQPGMDDDIPF